MKKIPLTLLAVLLALSFISLFTLYATKVNTSLLERQTFYIIIGFLVVYAMLFFDFRSLKYFVWVLYFAGIVALIALLVIGKGAYGAQRWISLKVFSVQPSEFEKIILILFISYIFSLDYSETKKFIFSLTGIVFPALLIFKQPDLGTTIIIFIIYLFLVLFSLDLKYFFSIVTASLVSIPLALKLLKPYQRLRILAFLNPQRDPLGSGYNVIQSLIAVGAGRVTGKWFGSTQTTLHFVPVQYADFIFSAIGEMGGFIGSLTLLFLYLMLSFFIIKVYRSVKDLFGKYIVIGVFTMFITQIFINIGMCIGIMPVTGIPLPFVSYGGSSMLTNFIAIGLVLNIYIYREEINIAL